MSLKAENISVRFSGVHAIDRVSLTVDRSEILGLIGPNGAGKTTLLNVLTGFQLPEPGTVMLDDTDVTRHGSTWFARNGVVRTFQAVRLFPDLTVSENIEASLSSLGVRRSKARRRAAEIVDYVGIAHRLHVPAKALNYGDERRVGIARAIALDPSFLLLDEPAAGMNIGEADQLCDLIRRIQADIGCGVVVIEHNMRLVSRLCHRLHMIAGGVTVAEGTPEAVMASPEFHRSYLGTERAV